MQEEPWIEVDLGKNHEVVAVEVWEPLRLCETYRLSQSPGEATTKCLKLSHGDVCQPPAWEGSEHTVLGVTLLRLSMVTATAERCTSEKHGNMIGPSSPLRITFFVDTDENEPQVRRQFSTRQSDLVGVLTCWPVLCRLPELWMQILPPGPCIGNLIRNLYWCEACGSLCQALIEY
eukprot:scaffold478_cov409-Prasinococcus_capsulatus_cf.AAC.22